MTVAPPEALVIHRCLATGIDGLARRFDKAAGPISVAWRLSTGDDLALRVRQSRASVAAHERPMR